MTDARSGWVANRIITGDKGTQGKAETEAASNNKLGALMGGAAATLPPVAPPHAESLAVPQPFDLAVNEIVPYGAVSLD
jgi:hypothetical protein